MQMAVKVETAESEKPAVVTSTPIDEFDWLPCTLSVEAQVLKLTVGDLIRLQPGDIVETNCAAIGDLQLRVNGTLIAWTEFEVLGDRLGARITQLA